MSLSKEVKKGLRISGGLLILLVLVAIGGLLAIFPGLRVGLQARLGDTESMLKMGAVTQELHWDEDACEAGNPRGCWLVWNVNQDKNHKKALEALKHGAELELKQRREYACLLELTRVHEYGLLGQPRNPQEAEKIRKQYLEIHRELRAKGMIL
ncbi:hypothetical protein [Geothrix alkalitolerans]|uniref:hypothetical protein n=1 Tax=Geothrix alkalitolerans TaxID=2922724 RepID=UPI001FB009BE|nr:hypothetical protein [Geothrix alkalitolerans]